MQGTTCGINFVHRTISLWLTPAEHMFFVYILKSLVNGKSYIGSTSLEVSRRLLQHNIGTNKWTKANKPFELVFYESYVCKTDAILREKFYKSGVGKQIKELILSSFRRD